MGKRIKLGEPVKTREIGSRFKVDGKTYEVVECDRGCRACDMYEDGPDDGCGADIDVCGLCFKGFRGDNKDVVFRLMCDGEKKC